MTTSTEKTVSPANALRKFAEQVNAIADEMMAEHDANRYQIQHRAEMAEKYNVESRLYGPRDFFRECARKEACRRNQAKAA